MKKILILFLCILFFSSPVYAETMADEFVPEFSDTQINISVGDINPVKWIKNVPKNTKTEILENDIDKEKIGMQYGKVKLIFSDASERIVDVPIEVVGPMTLDKSPVHLNEVIDPLDRIKNVPRGWVAYHKIIGDTSQLGDQRLRWEKDKTIRNQVNFRLDVYGTVLVRFWLQVVPEEYDLEYRFVSQDGKTLPDQVKELLPEDRKVKYGEEILLDQPAKTEVEVAGGKWVFKGWNKESPVPGQEDKLIFLGTWVFEEEKASKKDILVTYKFTTENEKQLPGKINQFLPMNKKVSQGQLVRPEDPDIKILETAEGRWIFKDWDKESQIARQDEIVFMGTWSFEKNKEKNGSSYRDQLKRFFSLKESSDKQEDEKIQKTYKNPAYIKGYPDGSFKPDQAMTRAEAASIIARIKNMGLGKNKEIKFPDVKADHWASDYINSMAESGFVKAYPDGYFRPDREVTRAEFLQMLLGKNVEKVSSDFTFKDTEGHWAEDIIKFAHKKGLVSGYKDGNFRPDNKITRAEAVKILNSHTNRWQGINKEALDISKVFTDLDRNHWAYHEIMLAISDL